MVDVDVKLFQWFIDFLIQSILILILQMMALFKEKVNQTTKQLKKYANQLLEILENTKYILHVKTRCGMLVLRIYYQQVNLFRVCDFYYVPLIFFQKCGWVVKRQKRYYNAFQKHFDMRIIVNQKLMSMDKGIKFYSRSMTLSLRDNAKETFPTDNEGKSVVARRLIRIVQINRSQKCSYIKTSYFSVLHTSSKNEIKVELDLSNYAINSDLKKMQHILIHQNLLKRLI